VQIPAGEFRSQIATLSAQPGMGYLNELTQRRDVNWQPVRLAYEQWDYRQEGLTEAGAALIGIAVAMATGGAGAGMLGTTGTVSTAAANAAFTSLAAQASMGQARPSLHAQHRGQRGAHWGQLQQRLVDDCS
jgi:large exoprotein involved in heme utilization and adhesion